MSTTKKNLLDFLLREVKDFSSQSFSSDTLQGKSSEQSRNEFLLRPC